MLKLTSTVWLSELRQNPKWDEARFRLAYNIPPAEEIEGTPSQKRPVQGGLSFGPSQSPKRIRRNDNDDDDDDYYEYNNPVTPTRNGG